MFLLLLVVGFSSKSVKCGASSQISKCTWVPLDPERSEGGRKDGAKPRSNHRGTAPDRRELASACSEVGTLWSALDYSYIPLDRGHYDDPLLHPRALYYRWPPGVLLSLQTFTITPSYRDPTPFHWYYSNPHSHVSASWSASGTARRTWAKIRSSLWKYLLPESYIYSL